MARNLNHVTLIGRLGRDPELKQTKNGVNTVDFSIANQRDSGDNERVNWISCRAYKKTAELICNYCTKGKKILVEGEIWNDQWEKNGEKSSRTYVLVTNIEFIDGGKSSDAGNGPVGNTFTPKDNGGYSDEVYESYGEYDPSEEF